MRWRSDEGARPRQSLQPERAPPPDYYANNLLRLLRFVAHRYAGVLDAPTRLFIDQASSLSVSAVRLLARLVSRKGPVFHLHRLCYPEVSDTLAAVHELERCALLSLQTPIAADRLLDSLRVPELCAFFPDVPAGRKSSRIAAIGRARSDQCIRDRLARQLTWLTLPCQATMSRCQLLFFGGHHGELSAFVIQDLGLVRYPPYRLRAPDWLTDDPAAMQIFLRLHELAEQTRHLARSGRSVDEVGALTTALSKLQLSRQLCDVRERALLRIGLHFERQGEEAEALRAYATVVRHPARERQVRIMTRNGDTHGAGRLLQQMRRDSSCAAEGDFAMRFGQRRVAVEPARSLSLPGTVPAGIEAYALLLLAQEGARGWHLENRFVQGITGLLFWDVIFADVDGMFTRPFQIAPHDLNWPDFATVRCTQIERIERRLVTPGAVRAQMEQTLQRHRGIANPLVRWSIFNDAFLETVGLALPERQIARLAGFLIRQFGRFRTGFPDLFVVTGSGTCQFIEVKGPADALQGAQRRWLEVLDTLGLAAGVMKIHPCRRC